MRHYTSRQGHTARLLSTMLLRNRGILVFLCIFALAVVSIITHLSSKGGDSTADWIPSLEAKPVDPCPNKLEWLSSLNIAYPIQYAHRDIVVKPRGDLERKSLTRIDEELFPELQAIDLSKDSGVELRNCKDPLILDVPMYSKQPADASHIIFGISTTLKRLDQSIPQLIRWLPNTQARLFVIAVISEDFTDIEKTVFATSAEKEALQSKMRGLGMDITIVDPLERKDAFSEKYFSLVKLLYSKADDRTLWISTIDDDTFIPSMSNLVAMLSKYDPSEQYYVGALSENWGAVIRYGLMAFGGAGVFLSRPLGQVLHDNYDVCKHTSGSSAGDIRIMECIYQFTTVKLTNERDLHQIDVWGDISGLFESGRSPLSLHHWKSGDTGEGGWPLPMMHTIADVCKECFLQRWQFGMDTVLASGFSISFYPKGDLKKAKFGMMEDTWDPTTLVDFSVNHGTEHSLGPTRPKLLLEEQKIQYRLVASAAVDGGVRQAYYHAGVNGDMDSLLELFWIATESEDLGLPPSP